MGIKETPTNFRVYYRCMKEYYNNKKKEAIKLVDDFTSKIVHLKNNIIDKISEYCNEYNIDLNDYEEFKNNEYTNGVFLNAGKKIFTTVSKEHIDKNLWDLYNLAKIQKTIHDLRKAIEYYDKLTTLSLKEYTEILKTYYTEVQRQMILEGAGYAFEGSLGWICINRCKINRGKPHINWAKTKKRKEEILAKGERLYNKEEAKWCKANGLDYNGIDPRVYLKNEYCYEIPLLDCHITNGSKFKFIAADYRGNALRGKTNEDILEEAEYNTKNLCKLPLDIRTKLNLCVISDKTLYSKFIRNENQKPINASKANWKNRQ